MKNNLFGPALLSFFILLTTNYKAHAEPSKSCRGVVQSIQDIKRSTEIQMKIADVLAVNSLEHLLELMTLSLPYQNFVGNFQGRSKVSASIQYQAKEPNTLDRFVSIRLQELDASTNSILRSVGMHISLSEGFIRDTQIQSKEYDSKTRTLSVVLVSSGLTREDLKAPLQKITIRFDENFRVEELQIAKGTELFLTTKWNQIGYSFENE